MLYNIKMSNIQIIEKDVNSININDQYHYRIYTPFKIYTLIKKIGQKIGMDVSINHEPFGIMITKINNEYIKNFFNIGDKILFINKIKISDFTRSEIKQLILKKKELEFLVKSCD